MTSKLIVNSIRHTGASADAITMDASGNVTFPGNATCSGTPSGFGGITMADQWRITTGFSSSNQVLNSNWERHDTYGAGAVGSSLMTESSGVFSFPTTGIYLIHFFANAVHSGRSRYVGVTINTTTDNSSYGIISNAYDSLPDDTSAFSQMSCSALFDVTNVSTHKVYFQVLAEVSVTWEAHSDNNRTSAVFLRLGDT
mgnify:FL=1